MAELSVTLYGGIAGDGPAGEVGGNRILVQDQQWCSLCDFGARFKLDGL